MLTVSEALAAILDAVSPGPIVSLPLEETLGLVIAESIISQVDSPPFDKSSMDGYAIRYADLNASKEIGADLTDLAIIEEVTAGHLPSLKVEAGQATRIMTGAPLPSGADAVVPVEETDFLPAGASPGSESSLGRVVIRNSKSIRPNQFILRRGGAVRIGTEVLQPGRVIRAQEIAGLAEMGFASVRVAQRPTVAILATGDELVPVGTATTLGQIQNSNEPMLAAQIQQAHATPVRLGIARDDRSDLRNHIERGLRCDFLLLSGGVSAGKLDLVPSELAAAGVRQVFHKIQMRPGKPLWFGVLDAAASQRTRPCYVFGLPGNPVSSMVCCELFVRAALRRWSGIQPAVSLPISAQLLTEHHCDGSRPTYHPAKLEWTPDGPTVQIVDWIGSSDLRATVDANCMALLPAGDRTWQPGERLDVFPW